MSKKEQDISFFISFCIEQYKNKKGVSGESVVKLFDQYGVLEYLSNHYEFLHTQSHHWILDDIDQFIAVRQ